MKPRLSHSDLEAIFRFYADAVAQNEPISTYVSRRRESDASADLGTWLAGSLATRLNGVSLETTKEAQARECRMLLLEHADAAISDHYLTLGADEELRHICVAAMYGLETDEELDKKENELLWSYIDALWKETALTCLYEEQFDSYMPLDSFAQQYRAMTELYTRFLCNRIFSGVMNEHDRPDLQRVAQLYEQACTDSTVLELSDIRANYHGVIRKGIVEDLYPLQERFAKVAQAAQSRIKDNLMQDHA
jgi:hypothetical protein